MRGSGAQASGRRRGEPPRGRKDQEGSGLAASGSPHFRRCRILAESKALKATLSVREARRGNPSDRLSRAPTPGRSLFPKGDKGSVRGKSPGGKTHERHRHETRPEGTGRSKPARGCETLKSEGVGAGNPEVTGLPGLTSLKGTKPQESCRASASSTGGRFRVGL
jgi:hypothetical protein